MNDFRSSIIALHIGNMINNSSAFRIKVHLLKKGIQEYACLVFSVLDELMRPS